jgi:putative FmdB family regulatory protein
MPTYDYQCDGCGHEFELFQTIVDTPRRKCPECGKQKLRRMFGTGAAVMFKGSGFYQTDYRSESYKKAAKAEKPPATEGTSSDAKAKDGKAAESKAEKAPAAAKTK